MIEFRDFSVTHSGATAPVLDGVNLSVGAGEFCLVIGQTGSGKSTLLRSINGLVPHFSGGTVTGEVRVDGMSTRDHPPRELAHLVGFVGQVPTEGFVTDVVEDELAYTMENLGVPPMAMRRRVEDTLDLLGLHELRDRPLGTLSGGQCQRVAIGAVLTASPKVLVLDEPTSALDPAAAEEVLAALARLVHDVGLTVVVAEHRLERVAHLADHVVALGGDRVPVDDGPPPVVMAHAAVAPPLVELGKVAGWDPLPLSVRDARRLAPGLAARLGPPPGPDVASHPLEPATSAASVSHLRVSYGAVRALDDVTLSFEPATITAVMGRNGSGKSTLLGALAGVPQPRRGSVRISGEDPQRLTGRARIGRVGLVPQDPGILLYAASVAEECASADRDASLAPGCTRATLDRLLAGVPDDRHPRDLSEGQRLALALAVVVAPEPAVLLADEPTRGLDYRAKSTLVSLLTSLASDGRTVIVATHDVEFVAQLAHRVVVLAQGEVVADGPTREVVCHSPAFSPQVAKVMAPAPWLTVEEVRAALETQRLAT